MSYPPMRLNVTTRKGMVTIDAFDVGGGLAVHPTLGDDYRPVARNWRVSSIAVGHSIPWYFRSKKAAIRGACLLKPVTDWVILTPESAMENFRGPKTIWKKCQKIRDKLLGEGMLHE